METSETDRLAVFARLGSRPIPRVVRMMKVAADEGFRAVFCGALREAELPREDLWGGIPVVRLGQPFPLLNGRRPFLYVKSVIRYNIALFRFLRQREPSVVHASDFETFPAAALYSWRRDIRFIYNIHDNLAQRYNVPRLVGAVLNQFEGLAVLASSITVVPEAFRRDALPRWCRHKVRVVRNTPEDPGFSPPVYMTSERIRIFFAGWLDWGRGLRALIKMAEENPDIELRVAGEGSPEIIATLERHPKVAFLGFLDHESVIEETKKCHFVPALYDPARTINRFAASNKLAESLAVGRPVIINSEMEIAAMFRHRPCVISKPYRNVSDVIDEARALVSNEEKFEIACIDARNAYEKYYSWPPVREEIRGTLGR